MITQGKVSQTSAFISQLQNYDHDHDGPYGKLEMINHRDLYDNHPHGFKTGELSDSSRLFSSLRSSKTRQSRGKVVTQGLLQVVCEDGDYFLLMKLTYFICCDVINIDCLTTPSS